MRNFLLVGILILAGSIVFAQETEPKSKKELKAEKKAKLIEEIKALVENKAFVFKAANVNPLRERTIVLTSEYEVKLTKDSIFSFLPYFGVAYRAEYGGTESPMIFNQPLESCETEKTKNGYLVKVSVKNKMDVLDFGFHISETGYTSLNVTSINRQAISYYGNVVPLNDEKQ